MNRFVPEAAKPVCSKKRGLSTSQRTAQDGRSPVLKRPNYKRTNRHLVSPKCESRPTAALGQHASRRLFQGWAEPAGLTASADSSAAVKIRRNQWCSAA